MPSVTIQKITCDKCGKVIEIPMDYEIPFIVRLLRLYRLYGWINYDAQWFCPDCIPERMKVIADKHPQYSDYRDYWDNREKDDCKSMFFLDEPYDPYAAHIQSDLCRICHYMRLGYEDDGSSWMMCCVDDPECSYGHNLYSGHFYGSAIRGRICPYFSGEGWKGRDPEKDKKNGCFHVPYNECYDGD